MAQLEIDTGASPNDGTGTIWRTAWTWVNLNFKVLFAALFDNVVVVKSESDLPASVSVGGVDTHVLEEKQYVIDGNVTITDPLAFPGAGKMATITAINRSALTYTGGIALFRDPDAEGNIEVAGLTEFRAPGAKMWDITAASGIFSFQSSGEADRFVECSSLGTVDCNGTSAFNIFFGSIQDFDQGLVVTDPVFFEINTCFVMGNNAVGCTYFTVQGASTVGSVNFDTLTVGNGSNETLFDINANIDPGVDSVNFRFIQQEGGINGTVFAPGSIDTDDNVVLSTGNSFIADTRPDGLLSMQGNLIATAVAVPGTYALVAGAWVVERVSQFSGDVNGRLTSTGPRDVTAPITFSCSVEPVSGGSQDISIQYALNGTLVPNSKRTARTASGSPASITLPWQDNLSPGNFVEVWVTNDSAGTSVLVSSAISRVN